MKKHFTKLTAAVLCLLMLLTIAPTGEFLGTVYNAFAEDTYKTAVKVYSDAKIVEHTTQYRYRVKAHQISTATSISGWTRDSEAGAEYGVYTDAGWTKTQPSSTSDVVRIKSGVSPNPKTVEDSWNIYYYRYWNTTNNRWQYTYGSGMGGKKYTKNNVKPSDLKFYNSYYESSSGNTYDGYLLKDTSARLFQDELWFIEKKNTHKEWFVQTRTKTIKYNYIQYTNFSQWSYTEVTSLDELSFERQTGVDYTLETESRPVAIDEYGVIYSEDMTKIYYVPEVLQTECFNIPATVTEICDAAFYNCAGIKEVVIPVTVTKIDANAFNNCTALESVIIPEKVTTVGNGAFANCSALGSVFFKAEAPITLGTDCFTYTAIDCFYVYFLEFKDAWLPYASSWNGYPLKGYNPPGERYSNIDANGTDSQGFTYSLNTSNKTATITAYSGGANVVFPKRVIKDSVEYSVNAFATNAFKGKTNITKVSMSKKITAIPANAFDGCTGLTEISYNGAFNSIGEYAFRNCSNLKYFGYLKGLTSIAKGAFYNCSKLTDVSIPSGVKTIGETAFYGCAKIGNLVIPSSITSIGASAFYGCKAIAMVTFEGAPSIGANAFANCTALATAKYKSGPSSSLGSGAFGGTSGFFVQYPGNNNTWKSQVSNYKWKGYDAYSSDIISKIGGGGKTRPYIIQVVNYKNAVLKGATVTVNGVSQTVPADGKVYFAMPSGSSASVSINPNNSDYAKFNESSHKLNKRTAVDCIVIYANHSISGKSFYGQDISKGSQILNRRYHGTSWLVVSAHSPLKITKVEIYSGNSVIVSKKNPASGDISFKISNDAFLAEKGVEVRMTTEDGVTTTKKLNIVVFDGKKYDYNFSISTINDNLDGVDLGKSTYAFLKKMKFKTSVPKFLNGCSLSIVNKQSTVSITLSKKSEGSQLSTHWKSRAGASVSIEMAYNASNKKMYVAKSTVAVSESFNGNWSFPFSIWGIPFVFEIDVQVGGSGAATIKFDNKILLDSLSLSAEGAVTFSLGLGFKYCSAGAYGKVGLKWTLVSSYHPKSSQSYLYGTGEIGVYAKILTKKKTWKILGVTNKQLYPSTRSSAKQLSKLESFSSELYDPELLTPIDRDYLETRSDWLSGLSSRKLAKAKVGNIENTAELATLQTSVYEYLEPKIITCNGTTMMVYADDIASRGQNNLQALVYSIYNPATGVWSAPQKIDNNDTLDNNFELYSDGACIYVVYSEANKTFGDKAELEEISASTDVSIARYDTTTGRFDMVESINHDEIYDMTPAFAMLNNIPTAVWVRNTGNDVFGMDNSNEIVYSQYINGGWTAPSVLVSKMPQVTSIAVGKLNGTAYVAATSDADNNPDTQDDNKLVLADFNGTIKEVETGINNNANAQFVSYKGTDTLIWSNNGQVLSLTNAVAAPAALIASEEFAIDPNFGWVDCNNGKYSVTFVSASEEEGSNVYTVYYDGNEWTNPIKVTNTDKYVGAYDVAYVNNKFVVPYRDTTVTFSETEDTFSTSANLCVAYISPVADAYVADAILDRQSLAFGEEANMTLSIFNNGFNDLENARITMKNAAGQTVFTTTETVQIASGESKDVDVTFVAPTAVEEGSYQIFVEDVNGANKEELKAYEIDLWQSDLCVEAEQLILGEENSLIVNVTNDGFVPSAAGQLKVATGTFDSAAEPFATIDVESIEPGATNTYLVELNDDIYTDDETSGIVTAWITTEGTDAVESNNYSTASIVRFEEDEGCDEDEVVKFAPDLSTDSVSVDLAASKDEQIAIERNGNAFSKVKDLAEGTQYTYTDDTLTLKQAYLSSLEQGIHEIELVFNEGLDNEYAATVIISVTDSTIIPVSGSVTIEGDAVFGNTLEVNTESIEPENAEYKIEWKRDGNVVGTDTSYVVKADDIGKNLTASIIGENGFGGMVTSRPIVSTKAAGATLLSPVEAESNYTSISLVSYEGYEYKCNNGKWTTSSVFEGLTPDTAYSFYVRKAETATHTAGESSDVVKISTKPIPPDDTKIVIDGTPERGKTLTAVIIEPGTATYSYQWYRNDSAIQGATSKTYTTTAADVNCQIKVEAIASGTSIGKLTSNPVIITCNHEYKWVTTKQPTCEEKGFETGTCVCGNTDTREISPLGHAAADSNGNCTRCGKHIADPIGCKWCGKTHSGLFGWLIKLIHSILAAIFGAKY